MFRIPWRYVNSWNCIACGYCCKGYSVVLNFVEWMNVVRNYGIELTSPGLNKFYLKHRSDGSCVFLHNFYGKGVCSLQHMKPQACRLWPFKILLQPKYGRAREATFNYGGKRLFIYVDPSCAGIKWGEPAPQFMKATLTEFIELAAGMPKKQVYSTSRMPINMRHLKTTGRRLI